MHKSVQEKDSTIHPYYDRRGKNEDVVYKNIDIFFVPSLGLIQNRINGKPVSAAVPFKSNGYI